MNYIIFDLEWNQPPDGTAMLTEPVYLTGEIVQIGAVKLDEAFRPVDELRLYIVPRYYTKMHRRIASLTGIHDRDIQEKGMPFPEAFEKFAAWCGEEYAYMTWSLSDQPMLIDNMRLHGMDVSNLPQCYDIQRIFGREIMRSTRRYALDHALEILNEQGDAAHDALHDARNTAKVCNHLDLDVYLQEYATRLFAQPHHSRIYESVAEILADEELRGFECPWCGEEVKCAGWIAQGAGEYITMGVCPQEDEFFVILECVRHAPGEYRVSRLIYDMSDDLWELYQDKREAQPV